MPRVKPRLYKGFRDIFAGDLIARRDMIEKIRIVYERYGFAPLETPAIEYVDVLGKFLPEADQPEGGIFSFKNEDKEWIALRYDLTAPLSRVVSQYQELQRPYRRYQVGPVWRFEKPGPGRFREFYQCDFDTVGTSSMAADTEVCCVMADTLEALGIERGQYLVKVNNRKVLNGVLDAAGLLNYEKVVEYRAPSGDTVKKTMTYHDVLRAIDKLDKVGIPGVRELLTRGRKDPSGDFTPGCALDDSAVELIEAYLNLVVTTRLALCEQLQEIVKSSVVGHDGIKELRDIDSQLTALGYNEQRVIFDPTVVRGLSYYTGPVFEGTLTFDIKDEDGTTKSFGSVFGGGRYDDLVERFTGQRVPATGASIGVDRLLAALKHLGRIRAQKSTAKVLVTVMDQKQIANYQKIAFELRAAGINTELFMGKGSIGNQMKYADTCGIPLAIIAGENEFNAGTLQVKNLWLGLQLSQGVDNETWRRDRPAQFEFPRAELISKIRETLTEIGEI